MIYGLIEGKTGVFYPGFSFFIINPPSSAVHGGITKGGVIMNYFKFQAFLKEFPFLRELGVDENVDSIKIRRADENLLAQIPSSYYWDGSMGVTDTKDTISFVLEDGNIIEDVVRQAGEWGSNYAHSQRKEWEGESVLEALSRLDNPDRVVYIVWVHKHLHDWVGSERESTFEVTIYKTPKGVKYSDLIRKAEEQALREVRAEADF